MIDSERTNRRKRFHNPHFRGESMALVFHMPEAQLNAWLATRIPRNPSRSGGLIKTPEIEPITRFAYHPSIQRKKRTRAAKRRTFRDFN